MRTTVAQASECDWIKHRNGGEDQDDQGKNQNKKHRQLHVIAFDLLAQILRSSADHQAGNEDREHDEDQHPVKPRAHTAKDHLAQHDVDHQHHAAERGEGVVRGVHCAATGVGRGGGKERGLRDAVAHLLTFQIAAGVDQRGFLVDPMQQWVWSRLGPVTNGVGGDEEDGHGGKHRPAVARRAGHLSQRDRQRGGNQQDQSHLDEVAEGGGIFKRVCTVGVEEASTIGAQFLNHFLRGYRSLGQGLGAVLQGGDGGIRFEILYDPLANQDRRHHQADRQQDP